MVRERGGEGEISRRKGWWGGEGTRGYSLGFPLPTSVIPLSSCMYCKLIGLCLLFPCIVGNDVPKGDPS